MDLNEDDMAVKAANRRRQPKKKKKMVVVGDSSATEATTDPQTAQSTLVSPSWTAVLRLL
jgi:hypothetical protein